MLPHKATGARSAVLKRTCLSLQWGGFWTGEEKFPVCTGWMRVLVVKTYRIGAGMVEWEVVFGGLKEGGQAGRLVIIWSLSTRAAPHSPTAEGPRPCCAYHRPPMDSLQPERNKRQECVLPLPPIYLRLSLLTPTPHVSQKNGSSPWLTLYFFIMKWFMESLANLE